MSDFVNCVGCGATIHKTATACPKCGAPQKTPAPASEAPKVADSPLGYAAVPWFRRRWFVLICLVTITPVASILAMTGETFYNSKDEVKQFPKNVKTGLMIATFVWILFHMNSGNSSGVLAGLGLIVFALLLAFKK
jgi:hypothetical protein